MSSRPVGENVFIGPFNKLQYIRDDLVKSVCYGEWQKHRILKPFTSKIWNLILLTSHHISLCWPFRTFWQSEISLIVRRRWKLIGSLGWESIELQRHACFSNSLSCELKKRVMFNTTPFQCIFLHELLKAVLFFVPLYSFSIKVADEDDRKTVWSHVNLMSSGEVKRFYPSNFQSLIS